MNTAGKFSSTTSKIDLDKYRLRRFVDRLIDMGEVEIHDEPVSLTGLSAIIERTEKAVLFKNAGPEQVEMVAKTAGNRKRLAAAFDTSEDKLYDEYFKRLANPQPLVEVPSGDAPVHEVKITGKDVDLTKLPFYPHHAYDGSCYLSSAIDYTIDPATGRRNVGCRRLSLRNRYETGTNVTAPSDLKRIYTACVARGERLPVTFTVGTHPLDFVAATMRQPGDELRSGRHAPRRAGAVVKSLTNDILVPADAEMTLEGYLDERGYVEPEGPFGEYMGYYGAIHMDPVFHCTAITMRRDVLHHTLLHGSAFVLDQTDSANISAMRTGGRGDEDPQDRGARAGRGLSALGVGRRQHAARLDQAALLRRGAPGHRGAVRRHLAAQARLRVRRGHRHPQRPAGRMGARHALPGRPGPRDPARHAGHDHGPLAQRPADRRQVGLRLHQAVRPRRRDSADPKRRQDVQGPGPLPDRRAGARRRRCSTPTSSSRSAATTAARSPARSTSCARTAASAATATAAIILQQTKPGVTGIVGELYHDPNEGRNARASSFSDLLNPPRPSLSRRCRAAR